MLAKGQIREAYFDRVFNLGNYETFHLGLHAAVGAGQNAETVIEDLDAFTLKMRNERVKGKWRDV